MQLTLTILHRFLWVIEILWAIGLLLIASFDSFSFTESMVLLVLGLIPLGLLHFVFTAPIGKKLKEGRPDEGP